MKNIFRDLAIATVAMITFISISGCAEQVQEQEDTEVEAAFDLDAAKQEIVEANRAFMLHYNAGDSTGLAALYTEDAKFMMHGAPAVAGRDKIESVISAIMGSGITSVDLVTLEVWGTEDLIAEEGQLSLFVGDDKVEQGKYIVLWKNVDGQWKLFRDIFNSDLTPEAQE